jgi:hypothetical protein
LVFEKNANFFAENCRKSPKIVIITSTPGHPDIDQVLKISFFRRKNPRTLSKPKSARRTTAAPGLQKGEKPGVDVMMTIFGNFGQFSAKNWHFSQKSML